MIYWASFRHEHIYEAVEEHLVRSDEFPEDIRALERVLNGSRIILSTLCMLSNPALHQNGMFTLVPVNTLVVDEASQINVFEYMVRKFVPTLTLLKTISRVFSSNSRIPYRRFAFSVILGNVWHSSLCFLIRSNFGSSAPIRQRTTAQNAKYLWDCASTRLRDISGYAMYGVSFGTRRNLNHTRSSACADRELHFGTNIRQEAEESARYLQLFMREFRRRFEWGGGEERHKLDS